MILSTTGSDVHEKSNDVTFGIIRNFNEMTNKRNHSTKILRTTSHDQHDMILLAVVIVSINNRILPGVRRQVMHAFVRMLLYMCPYTSPGPADRRIGTEPADGTVPGPEHTGTESAARAVSARAAVAQTCTESHGRVTEPAEPAAHSAEHTGIEPGADSAEHTGIEPVADSAEHSGTEPPA